ncbi:MAG: hypothetical protein V4574_14310 [Pseudomonadota bacterium]
MPDGAPPADIAEFGLGPRLDTREIPHNPWLAILEWDALQVLQAVSRENPIAFAFTASRKLQAGANTLYRQILVSGEVADMMCRLCAAIVGAGVFIKFGNPTISWTPEEAKPKPIANALENDFFDWKDGYIPWRDDPERQQLFAFLLIQTHRFVLLHEAAHILHRHSGGGSGKALGSVVDGGAPLEQDEAVAATKMARELIADTEAFHLHFRLLEHRFSEEPQDEMAKLLHEKLVGTPRERLRMTLLAAFLVFQILDHREWSIETARLRSHPPAPFRMKAIYATAVELKHPRLSLREIREEIVYARYLGSVVVDIGLNRLPQLGWLKQVDGPEFDTMFGRIYDEMHKWADPSRLQSA